MSFLNTIEFYWRMFWGIINPKLAKEWESIAMKNPIFAKYQDVSDRNAYWLSLPFRERTMLVDSILIATIGGSYPHLQSAMFDNIHNAAVNRKLVANKK
jgi:hypothetical protein